MDIIKILLVEDSLSTQSFIRSALEFNFRNVQVDLAKNGVIAMKAMQDNTYDIILSDWDIPLVSGDKLLQWVRETASLKHMPFIMITAKTNKNDVLRAKELGANDYIVKPVTIDVLMNKLSENLDTLIRTV